MVDTSFIAFANQLADLSGEVIFPYFRQSNGLEIKSDASPVTLADREGERVIREAIMEAYPNHGIWGEEFGAYEIEREFVWVLDPVDGTKSFISGFPTFGTLISLTHNKKPILGVIDQPISGERWVGVNGVKTLYNEGEVKTSSANELSNCILSTTSPYLFSENEKGIFEKIKEKAQYTIFGYDCYAYAQLASGNIHIVIESGLKPHDYCALAPVVIGAGGVMTDWNGKPLDMNSDGRVIAAANPALHAEILKLLG
jgi:inositol-phosphate phosphatase/L-galactose 1-phosphate phosphatase/histidinol-phosphatase